MADVAHARSWPRLAPDRLDTMSSRVRSHDRYATSLLALINEPALFPTTVTVSDADLRTTDAQARERRRA